MLALLAVYAGVMIATNSYVSRLVWALAACIRCKQLNAGLIWLHTSLLNALYATDTVGGDTNKTVSFKVYSITCVDKKSPQKNETITKWALDLEKLKKAPCIFFPSCCALFFFVFNFDKPPFFSCSSYFVVLCLSSSSLLSLSLFLEKPEGLSWLKTVEGWLISSLHKFLPAAREFLSLCLCCEFCCWYYFLLFFL